ASAMPPRRASATGAASARRVASCRIGLHNAPMSRRFAFYLGAVALVAFEFANVWFIMPMPGSQRLRSIDFAYFLFTWRWGFRALFAVMMLAGLPSAFSVTSWRKVAPALVVVVAGAIAYMANFVMAADRMFMQPRTLTMARAAAN